MPILTDYEVEYSTNRKLAKKYPPLSRVEQIALVKKYKDTGNTIYRDRLVLSNMKLIVSVAKKFHLSKKLNSDLFTTLISIGKVEAIECIDRYNCEMGNATISSWIRNSIERAMMNYSKQQFHNGNLSIYRRAISRFDSQYLESIAHEKFLQENHYEPQYGQEFILNRNDKDKKVIFGKNSFKTQISLHDVNVDDINEVEYNQYDIVDNRNYVSNEMRRIMREVLTEREIVVCNLFFGEDDNASLSDQIVNIPPENKYEKLKLYDSGSNPFILNDNINIVIVRHNFHDKKNDTFFKLGDIEFNYHEKYNGNYIIYTSDQSFDIAQFNGVTKITNNFGQNVLINNTSYLYLKCGSSVSIQSLSTCKKKLISKMRKNKDIFKLINNVNG
jgi:DNA-directed RNA polymerase sigma subunit (sigma70/sigma32)